jgi:hypothetical protein
MRIRNILLKAELAEILAKSQSHHELGLQG